MGLNYRYPESELDERIHGMQDELFRRLTCMWYISTAQYQSFGRIYRNPLPDGSGFKPEFYAGDSEYKDTLLDDRFAVVSFFGVDENVTQDGTQNTAAAHCVFFVHLGRIKFRDRDGKEQILMHRGDLEARNAVQAVLNQNLYGFEVDSVITGPNALREYESDQFAKFDMQPWHTFRINGTLRWDAPNINNYNLNN